MVVECTEDTCLNHKLAIKIEDPTWEMNPRNGVSLCKEAYCSSCGEYMSKVDNDVPFVVKRSMNNRSREYYKKYKG